MNEETLQVVGLPTWITARRLIRGHVEHPRPRARTVLSHRRGAGTVRARRVTLIVPS